MPKVGIQIASTVTELPEGKTIRRWVRTALRDRKKQADLTIRITDMDEARQLNKRWRGSNEATNVLSFPALSPGEIEPHKQPYLGDIVICAPVICAEARQQGKELQAHLAHIVIHGVLHLLGYDHIEPKMAADMENLEIRILSAIGVSNPYIIEE